MDQTKLTYEACSQCRMSRSKCNGDGRQPCARCVRRKTECIYLERRPESKDDLRRQVEELRSQEEERDVVFKGLISAEHSDWILKALWRREPISHIASRLLKGLLEDDNSTRDDSSVKGDDRSSVAHKTKSHDGLDIDPSDAPSQSLIDTRPLEHDLQNLPTADAKLDTNVALTDAQIRWGLTGLTVPQLRELLAIFFECQYIPFFFINKSLFLRDFLNGGDEHCSKALLRSIICVACRLQGGYDAPYSFYVNLGHRCFDELESCLHKLGSFRFCIPDAQSLGLAALHELGCGSKTKSIELADEAVRRLDAVRHQQPAANPPKGFSALSATLVESISLAWVIRMTVQWSKSSLGSQASTPATNNKLATPPESDAYLENLFDTLEKEETSKSEMKRVPALSVGLASDVYRTQFKADATFMKQQDLPKDLKETFQNCLFAYDAILAHTEDAPDDGVTQPALHFMHVFHHFCLVILFRPYCHVQTTDSNMNPRDICLEAAQAVLALSKSYNDHTPKKLVPCFVPLFVYTASMAILDLLGDGRGASYTASTPSSMVMSPTTPGSSSLATPTARREDISRNQSAIEDSPVEFASVAGYPSTAEVITHLASMEDVFPVAREVKKELEERHARPASQDHTD